MIKTKLRKQIVNRRKALSKVEWKNRSNAICDRLKDSLLFNQSNTIFAYFSFKQEVDLSPLFSLNKQWAFPRCVNKSLVWHSWRLGDSLIEDKYGIQTPLKTAPIVPVSSADIILVPTVAGDSRGYRLGYGGGFYDRLLASPSIPHVFTIGIVFDFSFYESLPVDSWDRKLNSICTETKFLNI